MIKITMNTMTISSAPPTAIPAIAGTDRRGDVDSGVMMYVYVFVCVQQIVI